MDKNQFLEIKEFAKDYTKLERRAFRLGGANQAAGLAPKWGSNAPAGKRKIVAVKRSYPIDVAFVAGRSLGLGGRAACCDRDGVEGRPFQ